MAYHAISHHRSEQQTNTFKRTFLHTWASGVYCFRFYFFSSLFFRTTRGSATCLRGSLCPPSQSLSTFGGFEARFLNLTPPYIVGRTTDDRRIVVYEDYAPSLRRLPVRPVGGPTLRRI